MNTRRLLVDFARVFAVTLAVSAVVTLLWNLVVHGAASVDWETAFRFAVIFGIMLTWMDTRRGKGK